MQITIPPCVPWGKLVRPFVKDYKLFVRERNPLSQINFFVWEGHYRRGTLSPLCLRAPFLSPGGFGNNLAVNSPYNSSRLGVNLYNARFIMAYNGVSSDISHEPVCVLQGIYSLAKCEFGLEIPAE